MTIPSEEETRFTRSRYNRIAPIYDLLEGLVEKSKYSRWRERLWSQVRGPKVLEIGVGTGKNFQHHPANVEITGVDLSEAMLARARERARALQKPVRLLQMDAQRLDFADEAFDEVVATFVFCSVPDPVLGLSEALRVTRPGGRLLLLEHMLAERPALLARIMTWLDAPMHWITGVHIARRTVDNVAAAGWVIDSVKPLSFGSIFREIIAHKP